MRYSSSDHDCSPEEWADYQTETMNRPRYEVKEKPPMTVKEGMNKLCATYLPAHAVCIQADTWNYRRGDGCRLTWIVTISNIPDQSHNCFQIRGSDLAALVTAACCEPKLERYRNDYDKLPVDDALVGVLEAELGVSAHG